MTLVDTACWIDHLHRPNDRLGQLLAWEQVLLHPFVFGEISCGQTHQRESTLRALRELDLAPVAEDKAVMELVETRQLFGVGLGFVDAHLLASAMIAECALMTRDRALLRAAERIGVSTAA